jgi:Flp pilus assembly protein TadG
MMRLRIFRRLAARDGQALIEFILVLPMVFLLILNLVNFGGFFYAWITVANAARAGADYAVLGGASATGSGTPSAAKIKSLIIADIASLPNAASLTVDVCQNGVAATGYGSCSGLDSDPEPTNYVMTVIDVTYTYRPFISAFSFPSLGVYLTIPPTNVYQRAELRTLN